MSVEKILLITQVLSGLLVALDYFLPVETRNRAEEKLRATLPLYEMKLAKFVELAVEKVLDAWEIITYVMVSAFVLSLFISYISKHVTSLSPLEQFVVRWVFAPSMLLYLVPPTIAVVIAVTFIVVKAWFKFLFSCPKGVIAAIMFPVFFSVTCIYIYKLFQP
jgi:hypothetical protein